MPGGSCFGQPLSLRDVPREVGLTAGHLSTVVRRRTGRTIHGVPPRSWRA
jgi:hypothetical protein